MVPGFFLSDLADFFTKWLGLTHLTILGGGGVAFNFFDITYLSIPPT